MTVKAPYDEIADWYEQEFLAMQRSFGADDDFADRLGIDQALVELLGPGQGTCVEVGCGTGIYADRLRDLGYTPVGIDLSGGMLTYAAGRLGVAQADASVLPFADGSVRTAVAIMVHTDMADYPVVLREVYRILKPGGSFVHIGVHPCFCGGFADRSDPGNVVIKSGYLDGHWTTDSWTDLGIRDKVGAEHWPLAELLDAAISTGFRLDKFAEGAEPVPVTLSFRATKPA